MGVSDLSEYLVHLSIVGIFIWFAFIEQFTPIPEEVSLITLGYLAGNAEINPLFCGFAAFLGLTLVDNMVFILIAKGSTRMQRLMKKMHFERISHLQTRVQNHAIGTLIIMALLPKVRFFSPAIAAAGGIKWQVFFLVNSMTTLFYVVLYLLLGMVFHNQLSLLFAKMTLVQHGIFVFIMILIIAILVFGKRHLYRNPKPDQE